MISFLNRINFSRSNFWSGWSIGISGFFVVGSLKDPSNEWLYVAFAMCLSAAWLLKERS